MTNTNFSNTTLLKQISRRISPNCEMYAFAKKNLEEKNSKVSAFDYYFFSGYYLIDNLVNFFRKEKVPIEELSLLDFASGYGRFTRYFVHLFKEVTVSDLEQDMLDFNKRQFGVDGFKSTVDISKGLGINKKFDVVFVFSLFTHFNPDIWKDWFKAIFSLVAENGYMIISTSGRELHESITQSKIKEDVSFSEGNETRGRLDPQKYGSTMVTEKFVREKISDIDNITLVKIFKMTRFDMYHDIYIFKKLRE